MLCVFLLASKNFLWDVEKNHLQTTHKISLYPISPFTSEMIKVTPESVRNFLSFLLVIKNVLEKAWTRWNFRYIKLKLYRRSANPGCVCLGRAHPKIFILSRFAEVASIVCFHFYSGLRDRIDIRIIYMVFIGRCLHVHWNRYVKLTSSEQTLSKPNSFAEFSPLWLLIFEWTRTNNMTSCLICLSQWQT